MEKVETAIRLGDMDLLCMHLRNIAAALEPIRPPASQTSTEQEQEAVVLMQEAMVPFGRAVVAVSLLASQNLQIAVVDVKRLKLAPCAHSGVQDKATQKGRF